MKKVNKRNYSTGAVRMAEKGKKQVQLWLEDWQHDRIREIAKAERNSMTAIVRQFVLQGVDDYERVQRYRVQQRSERSKQTK